MFIGDAFVAEVASDFINTFQTAHNQPFEVQLEADAQVKVLIKFVMVCNERTGCRAAVNWLKDGCFNFQKTEPVQELAQSADRGAADAENFAHLRVDCQVHIALPETCFGVGQGGMSDRFSVYHFIFIRRQLEERFGEHPIGLDQQGYLSAARAEHGAFRFDEIAQVKVAGKSLQKVFTNLINAEKELRLAFAVFDMGKAELAHVANRAQPASQHRLNFFRAICRFSGFKSLYGGCGGRVSVRGRWVGLYALGAQAQQLLQSDIFEFRKFILQHKGLPSDLNMPHQFSGGAFGLVLISWF